MNNKYYSAFISYSHATDGKLAPAIQSALHQFAKPWYKLRAMKVFRDETSLSINPGLWSYIKKALDDSEYFILLASPEAAGSKWIRQEIDHWLQNNPANRILIVLIDGEISWEDATTDFEWNKTTAIPTNLSHIFYEEPLYLDLRWTKTETHLSLKHPKFKSAIADLAATIHSKPKDEIIGEDIQLHRKAARLAWSAVILLIILTSAALIASVLFVNQRDLAQMRELIARQHLYTAHINQAWLAWNRSDPKGVDMLLKYQIPEHGQIDPRGFEWYYLWQLSHRELLSIKGPSSPTLAISSNRKTLASGGTEFDAGSFELNELDETKIKIPFYSVEHGEIKTWDMSTGQERFTLKSKNKSEFSSIAFSPDDKTLAAVTSTRGPEALYGNDLIRWDVATGETLSTHNYKYGFSSIDFSPNGRLIAVGMSKIDFMRRVGEVALFDISKDEFIPIPIGKVGLVRSVVFSPDGKTLAIAHDGENQFGRAEIKIWEIEKSEIVLTFKGHEKLISSLAFSSNGKYLVAAEHDGTARLWNLLTEREEVVFKGHSGPVYTVALTLDNKILATGSWDKTVRLWNTATGEMIGILPKQSTAVDSVVFSHDGRLLITANVDGTVKLWNVAE